MRSYLLMPKGEAGMMGAQPKELCFTDTYLDGVSRATLTEEWLLNPLPSGSGSHLFISISFSLLFLASLSQVQSIYPPFFHYHITTLGKKLE